MGNYIFKKLICRKEVKILTVGLDAAGKTTMLYKLKLGEVVTTIPTIGFNVETISHKNVDITCWDVGVRDKIRPLLRHYLPGSNGLVFVVDSNDRERMGEAVTEILEPLLSLKEETEGIPVLVLANKQDLENAMTPEEITQEIEKAHFIGARPWKVFGTCALQGDGLYEALDWLTAAITEGKKNDFIDRLENGVNRADDHKESDKDLVRKDQPKLSYFAGMVEYFKHVLAWK